MVCVVELAAATSTTKFVNRRTEINTGGSPTATLSKVDSQGHQLVKWLTLTLEKVTWWRGALLVDAVYRHRK